MSNRVSDASRASGRVVYVEDEQYVETRRTRRPVREEYYYEDAPRVRYEDDERPSRSRSRYEADYTPSRSRSRDDDDVAPRRASRSNSSSRSEEAKPRRSTRNDDSYVRGGTDRPIRVKLEKDPEPKESHLASTARTGALIASRALGIGGFVVACIGGLLAIGGTHVIPGFGNVPNIGPGVAVAGVGFGAYLAGGIIEKSLTKDKK